MAAEEPLLSDDDLELQHAPLGVVESRYSKTPLVIYTAGALDIEPASLFAQTWAFIKNNAKSEKVWAVLVRRGAPISPFVDTNLTRAIQGGRLTRRRPLPPIVQEVLSLESNCLVRRCEIFRDEHWCAAHPGSDLGRRIELPGILDGQVWATAFPIPQGRYGLALDLQRGDRMRSCQACANRLRAAIDRIAADRFLRDELAIQRARADYIEWRKRYSLSGPPDEPESRKRKMEKLADH